MSRYIVERAVSDKKLEPIRFGKNGWNWYKLQDCIEAFGTPYTTKTMKERINMGKITNTLLVSKMLYLMKTPFSEWQQYKDGVIDAQGNVIVSKMDFRKAFSDPLFRIVRRFKMLLMKWGVRDSVQGMSLVSLFLMHEDIIGNSLTKEQSKEFLKEAEKNKATFDSEEKLLMSKFINNAGLLIQTITKQDLEEYQSKPLTDGEELYERLYGNKRSFSRIIAGMGK